MPNPNAAFQSPHRSNEVLAQFDLSAGDLKGFALKALGAIRGEKLLDNPGAGELARITLGNGVSVERAVEILSRIEGVRFAEPDYVVTSQVLSNDPAVTTGGTWGVYGDQVGHLNPFGSQSTEAWAAGFTGSTKVAVGV